jgi:O-methyltransferase involved in polyketide biosynthesis
MNPVSRTAFYCTGIRMLDAERPDPVVGDTYARHFMTDDALRMLELFKDEHRPNRSNVVHHRIIDDQIRSRLAADPDRLVVLVGAGFDGRAYRLTGGRWVEVDEPAIIEFKEERPTGGAVPPRRVPAGRADLDSGTGRRHG